MPKWNSETPKNSVAPRKIPNRCVTLKEEEDTAAAAFNVAVHIHDLSPLPVPSSHIHICQLMTPPGSHLGKSDGFQVLRGAKSLPMPRFTGWALDLFSGTGSVG